MGMKKACSVRTFDDIRREVQHQLQFTAAQVRGWSINPSLYTGLWDERTSCQGSFQQQHACRTPFLARAD